MDLKCINEAKKLEDTGFNYTMSLIQGKYKMFILYALMGFEILRFNELRKLSENPRLLNCRDESLYKFYQKQLLTLNY